MYSKCLIERLAIVIDFRAVIKGIHTLLNADIQSGVLKQKTRTDCVLGDRKRTAFDWALVVWENVKAEKPK